MNVKPIKDLNEKLDELTRNPLEFYDLLTDLLNEIVIEDVKEEVIKDEFVGEFNLKQRMLRYLNYMFEDLSKKYLKELTEKTDWKIKIYIGSKNMEEECGYKYVYVDILNEKKKNDVLARTGHNILSIDLFRKKAYDYLDKDLIRMYKELKMCRRFIEEAKEILERYKYEIID